MISTVSTHKLPVNHLIAYTATNIKSLLECSKEKLCYQHRLLPTLDIFINHMFRHCRLTPTILVVALIYLERLKNKLPQRSRGEFDTHYKMFICAAVLASKFVEDSNRMARSIYRFTGPLYTPKDMNEMERYFLSVIDVNKQKRSLVLYPINSIKRSITSM
ncbi:cyclin domain-containing protein [Sporodiniella umbellata]|nr:cyclin domain-containing protein [Sporodiniella umbellata]